MSAASSLQVKFGPSTVWKDMAFGVLLFLNALVQLMLHLRVLLAVGLHASPFKGDAVLHGGVGFVCGVFVGRLVLLCATLCVPSEVPISDSEHHHRFSRGDFVKRDQLWLWAEIGLLFILGRPWSLSAAHQVFLSLVLLPAFSQFSLFFAVHMYF